MMKKQGNSRASGPDDSLLNHGDDDIYDDEGCENKGYHRISYWFGKRDAIKNRFPKGVFVSDSTREEDVEEREAFAALAVNRGSSIKDDYLLQILAEGLPDVVIVNICSFLVQNSNDDDSTDDNAVLTLSLVSRAWFNACRTNAEMKFHVLDTFFKYNKRFSDRWCQAGGYVIHYNGRETRVITDRRELLRVRQQEIAKDGFEYSTFQMSFGNKHNNNLWCSGQTNCKVCKELDECESIWTSWESERQCGAKDDMTEYVVPGKLVPSFKKNNGPKANSDILDFVCLMLQHRFKDLDVIGEIDVCDDFAQVADNNGKFFKGECSPVSGMVLLRFELRQYYGRLSFLQLQNHTFVCKYSCDGNYEDLELFAKSMGRPSLSWTMDDSFYDF